MDSKTEDQALDTTLDGSGERYRLLFESNPLPVIVYDLADYSFLAVNAAALRHYGASDERFMAQTIIDLFHPDEADRVASWLNESDPVRRARPATFLHQDHAGRTMTVEVMRRLLTFDERPACLVVIHDVTRQQEVQHERDQAYHLLETRVEMRTDEIEKRRRVAESLRHILAILNSNRPLADILDFIVDQARDLLGGHAGAICSLTSLNDVCTVQAAQGLHTAPRLPATHFPGWQVMAEVSTHRQPVAISGEGGMVAPSPDSDVVIKPYRALLAVPLIISEEIYGCLIMYYPEEREFAEEEINLAMTFADQAALAIENAHLRERVERMAVMEERSRLARDLHDSVTQSLYSLTLLVEGWRRMLNAGKMEFVDDQLIEVGHISNQALREMRLLIHELRPPTLEQEGFLGALHQRLSAVERRSGVQARLVADDIVELPASYEEALYRIVIEALNNALKHAAANSVTVYLRLGADQLDVEIADDGCGFDLSSLPDGGGIGLTSMRERADSIGAAFEITSTEGTGTSVHIRLVNPPLS
ncbi:MAG: GAF domain-containing protein [Chloroflexi bacterium]|nr:GAF domain-containing protein [Chloroflexota bacterium]